MCMIAHATIMFLLCPFNEIEKPLCLFSAYARIHCQMNTNSYAYMGTNMRNSRTVCLYFDTIISFLFIVCTFHFFRGVCLTINIKMVVPNTQKKKMVNAVIDSRYALKVNIYTELCNKNKRNGKRCYAAAAAAPVLWHFIYSAFLYVC